MVRSSHAKTLIIKLDIYHENNVYILVNDFIPPHTINDDNQLMNTHGYSCHI